MHPAPAWLKYMIKISCVHFCDEAHGCEVSALRVFRHAQVLHPDEPNVALGRTASLDRHPKEAPAEGESEPVYYQSSPSKLLTSITAGWLCAANRGIFEGRCASPSCPKQGSYEAVAQHPHFDHDFPPAPHSDKRVIHHQLGDDPFEFAPMRQKHEFRH